MQQPSVPGSGGNFVCLHCGHQDAPPARFCVKCGHTLSPVAPDDSSRATLKSRLLHLGNAPWPLKVIMYLLIGQVILVSLLLLTQFLPQPMVDSGLLNAVGGRYMVTTPIWVVMMLSMILAFWFVLAAALRARWYIGLPLVLAVASLLVIGPAERLRQGVGVWEDRGQLGLLAVLGLWEVGLAFWQWFAPHARSKPPHGSSSAQIAPPVDTRSHLLRGGGLLGSLVIVLGYYGLELVNWGSLALSSQIALANRFLLGDLGTQVITLAGLLILVLLLGSTDILEWGEILVAAGWHRLKLERSPWRLWAITLLAALTTIAKVLILVGPRVWLALLVAAVLALILWSLVRLVPASRDWEKKRRERAVQLGAVTIFAYLVLPSQVTGSYALSRGLLADSFAPLFFLMALPVGLAALTIGLFFLLRLQGRKAGMQALWLFVVLVLLLLVIANVPQFLDALKLGAFFPLTNLQSGIQLFTALAVLVWGLSLVPRKRTATSQGSLGNALQLLIGLQLVFWIQDLLNGIATLQGSSSLALALLFLLTSGWSLLTSGDVTSLNGENPPDSRYYPREVQVLFFAGQTLVSTVLLLYLGSLQGPGGSTSIEDYLTKEIYSPLGLSVLGSLIAIMAFVQRLPRPAAQALPTEGVPLPARHRALLTARAFSWPVLGGGLVLAALLLAFVLTSALPHLLQQNTTLVNKGYSALIPGPNCDTGGTTWSLTSNAAARAICQTHALEVTDSSNLVQADMQFLPPNGQVGTDYSVSVHIDISQIPTGCAGVLTRFSARGGYENTFCDDGTWIIRRINQNGSQLVLAAGLMPKRKVADLGAIASGANQRLTVNGTLIATVSDATMTQGQIYLRLADNGLRPAAAQFSNFTYIPLVAPPSSPGTSAYHAARPGGPCDPGGAQWALKTPTTSELRCQADGTQITVHNLAILEFTPPGGLLVSNYQLSLTVDPGNLPIGCVGLITRATGPDFYWSRICFNSLLSTWSVSLNANGAARSLREGTIAPAHISTLTATASGSHLTFTLNGQQLISFSDTSYTSTAYVGIEVLNENLLSQQVPSVLISNFSYTSLK